MQREYSITYKTTNKYENWVNDACWQFLIIPQENKTQEYVSVDFKNSINANNEYSINGYGFKSIRIHPKQKFKEISFEANFKLIKRDFNPFDFEPDRDISTSYKKLDELNFKVDFEPFLKKTRFTTLPESEERFFEFDKNIALFENIKALNEWTSQYLLFKAGVTDVSTTMTEIISKKQGVCQDFTHLFCTLARKNGVPARYVSGYLHQGNGYFGDSQMHAWAETYIPNIGWMGFDPTNNLMVNENHIKVAHGKDYNDCSPLRGIIQSVGKNETSHSVMVTSQQQQ